MTDRPVLWSFRRCPYAIRARLALAISETPVALREVVLRNKPDAFLAASASASVPCLEAETVLDESRDIMLWALNRRDPAGWMLAHEPELIDLCDGPFKSALDRTKYENRFPDSDPVAARAAASAILMDWNDRLSRDSFITGPAFGITDAALLPFVRQFAHIDRAWFDAQDWPHLRRWLDGFLASDLFQGVMTKYPPWQPGQDEVPFP